MVSFRLVKVDPKASGTAVLPLRFDIGVALEEVGVADNTEDAGVEAPSRNPLLLNVDLLTFERLLEARSSSLFSLR
jgi:hypothetical protein